MLLTLRTTVLNNVDILPSFVYNNQCSSATLFKFVPVFIYSYAFNIILSVALQSFLLFDITKSRPTKFWPLLRPVIPRVVWDIDDSSDGADSVAPSMDSYLLDTLVIKSYVPHVTNTAPLFSSDVVISSLVLDLSILCTFGIASPYLGLFVCISVCCSVCQWRVMISRYLWHMTELNRAKEALILLKAATANIMSEVSFMQQWVFIASISTVLFVLYGIDMTADSNNQLSPYYFVLIVVVPIVLMFVIHRLARAFVVNKTCGLSDKERLTKLVTQPFSEF